MCSFIHNKKELKGTRWPFASVTYATLEKCLPTFEHLLQRKMISPVAVTCASAALYVYSYSFHYKLQTLILLRRIPSSLATIINSFHVFEHLNNLTNKSNSSDIPIRENLPYVTLAINICTRWRKKINSIFIQIATQPRWCCWWWWWWRVCDSSALLVVVVGGGDSFIFKLLLLVLPLSLVYVSGLVRSKEFVNGVCVLWIGCHRVGSAISLNYKQMYRTKSHMSTWGLFNGLSMW